jgi:hypothetical protein
MRAMEQLFRQRRQDAPEVVTVLVQEQRPGAPQARIDALVRAEQQRELEFQRRARKRLAVDLPLALREADPQRREAAVREVMDREKRYLRQREEAAASRVVAALEFDLLRQLSPEGAWWRLSELVQEHTLDCVAMAERFWPWEVLERYHPQLHAGCQCRLLGKGEAVQEGLMGPDDDVMEPAAAVRLAESLMAEAKRLEEVLAPEDLLELVEDTQAEAIQEAVQRQQARWGPGHSKGGQFKPKRGSRGTPTRGRVRSLRAGPAPSKQRDKGQDPTPASEAFRPVPFSELKQGDQVMIGGAPDTVTGVEPNGMISLEREGSAFVDPNGSVRVRKASADKPEAKGPGTTVALTAGEAGKAFGRQLRSHDPGKPEEDYARGEKAWASNVRGRMSDDAEAKAILADAIAENNGNELYRGIVDRHGGDAVVLVSAKGTSAPVDRPGKLHQGLHNVDNRRVAHTTITSDLAVRLSGRRKGKPVPGDDVFGVNEQAGYAAVLRHEFGHTLINTPGQLRSAHAISDEEREQLLALVPDDHEQVGRELGRYAAYAMREEKGGKDEALAEVFALATDPEYDPADWAPWVNQAASRMLQRFAPASDGRYGGGSNPDAAGGDVTPKTLDEQVAALANIKREHAAHKNPNGTAYQVRRNGKTIPYMKWQRTRAAAVARAESLDLFHAGVFGDPNETPPTNEYNPAEKASLTYERKRAVQLEAKWAAKREEDRQAEQDRQAEAGGGPAREEWSQAVNEAKQLSDLSWDDFRRQSKSVQGQIAEMLRRMPVGATQQLDRELEVRRHERGWILSHRGNPTARVDSDNVAGDITQDLWLAAKPDTGWVYERGGLMRVAPELRRAYEDADMERTFHADRYITHSNLNSAYTPRERLRYDWRAQLRDLDMTEADLDRDQEEFRVARMAAQDAFKVEQGRVYRELLSKREAFTVVDHSERLASKPWEVTARRDTVGVLGGDAFFSANGANLRLSRFKTREAAQKAVDQLHDRELARMNEELGIAAEAPEAAGELRSAADYHALAQANTSNRSMAAVVADAVLKDLGLKRGKDYSVRTEEDRGGDRRARISLQTGRAARLATARQEELKALGFRPYGTDGRVVTILPFDYSDLVDEPTTPDAEPDGEQLRLLGDAVRRMHTITRADVEAGRVPGVKWDGTLTGNVVAHMRDRQNMTVGPSAFNDRGEVDTLLFSHEVGHRVAQRILAAGSRAEGGGKLPDELLAFRAGGEGVRTRFDNPFGASELPEELLSDAYSELIHRGADPTYTVGIDGPDDEDSRRAHLAEMEGSPKIALLRLVRDNARELGLPAEQLYRYDSERMNGVSIARDGGAVPVTKAARDLATGDVFLRFDRRYKVVGNERGSGGQGRSILADAESGERVVLPMRSTERVQLVDAASVEPTPDPDADLPEWARGVPERPNPAIANLPEDSPVRRILGDTLAAIPPATERQIDQVNRLVAHFGEAESIAPGGVGRGTRRIVFPKPVAFPGFSGDTIDIDSGGSVFVHGPNGVGDGREVASWHTLPGTLEALRARDEEERRRREEREAREREEREPDTPPEPDADAGGEPPEPTGADPDASPPSYDQVAGLLARGAPAEGGVLVPGFFNYTGERGQIHETDGVLQLQWYFFRQSKDRRTRVAFTHLGNRLAREEGGRDERAFSRMYAGLAGPGWEDLTLIKPDEAREVALVARRHGYPLRSEVSDWLGGAPEEAPEPTMDDDERQARDLFAAVKDQLVNPTAIHMLNEAGFQHEGLWEDHHKLEDGSWAPAFQLANNYDTGWHIRYEREEREVPGERFKQSVATGNGVVERMDGPQSQHEPQVGEATLDWQARTGIMGSGSYITQRGDWMTVVTPTGEAFAYTEDWAADADEAGKRVITGVRRFTASPKDKDTARKYGLRNDPLPLIQGLSEADADRTFRDVAEMEPLTARAEGMPADRLEDVVAGRIRTGDMVDGMTPTQGMTTYRVELPEGVAYMKKYSGKGMSGGSALVHFDADGNVVDAGKWPPAGHDRPWQIVRTDAEREAIQAEIERRKEAELEQRRQQANIGVQPLVDAMAAGGKKRKVEQDELAELLGPDMRQNTTTLVVKLRSMGYTIRARRQSRVGGNRMISYTLRAPDGGTLKVRGGLLMGDNAVNRLELIPPPQTERRRLEPGKLWADTNELYVDALGRADELAERYGAVSHVTTIIDTEGSRGAMAHHEWGGAIVMSKSSGFKNRFTSYLKRRNAGEPLTDNDHFDFYDAMSTLQHELNHGIGKAGNEEGGLAFGTRHYKKMAGVLSAHGVMEEALTEEAARFLTLEWLEAQGLDDVLVAVERRRRGPGYSDYQLLGSYQPYRRRLLEMFNRAGVPEEEREALVTRMKFQMTPEERMAHLDEEILDRTPQGELNKWLGVKDGRIGPGRSIMGSEVRENVEWPPDSGKRRNRKAPLKAPVVPDSRLDGLDVPMEPHEAAQLGDMVRAQDLGEPVTGNVVAVNEPFAGFVQIRQENGVMVALPRNAIQEILSGPSGAVQGSGRAQDRALIGAVGDEERREVWAGSAVRVDRGGDGWDDGIVAEVSPPTKGDAPRYVKVTTMDGLSLWYSADRLR